MSDLAQTIIMDGLTDAYRMGKMDGEKASRGLKDDEVAAATNAIFAAVQHHTDSESLRARISGSLATYLRGAGLKIDK